MYCLVLKAKKNFGRRELQISEPIVLNSCWHKVPKAFKKGFQVQAYFKLKLKVRKAFST